MVGNSQYLLQCVLFVAVLLKDPRRRKNCVCTEIKTCPSVLHIKWAKVSGFVTCSVRDWVDMYRHTLEYKRFENPDAITSAEP